MTQTIFYVQRKSSGPFSDRDEPKMGVTYRVVLKGKRFKYDGEWETNVWAYFYNSSGEKIWDCNEGYFTRHFFEVPAPDWAARTGRKTKKRGTSNQNVRGNTRDREARRAYLLRVYESSAGQGTCRCYRCGLVLTDETVTVDRIVPGAKGGAYRRSNIRPACGACNSATAARAKA